MNNKNLLDRLSGKVNTAGSVLAVLGVTAALLLRTATGTPPLKEGNMYAPVDFSATNGLDNLIVADFSAPQLDTLTAQADIDTDIIGADGNVFRHSSPGGFTPPPIRAGSKLPQQDNNPFALTADKTDPFSGAFKPDKSGWGWLANDVERVQQARPALDRYRRDNLGYSGGLMDDKRQNLLGSRLREEFGRGGDNYFSNPGRRHNILNQPGN